MPKFLRAIRFDVSDTHVFPKVAGDHEWAIPGGSLFYHGPSGGPAQLTGKERQAFVSGFLALGSFGFSTIVSVADAEPDDINACQTLLADYLVREFNAPSEAAARALAADEIGFARDLAEGVDTNTLLAVKREVGEDGEIKEGFRIVIPPKDKPHTRIWDVVEEP